MLVRLLVNYQTEGARYERGTVADLPDHVADGLIRERKAETVPLTLRIPATHTPISAPTPAATPATTEEPVDARP